jgi:hypothetical protein
MKKHTLLSCALAVLLSGCGALHKSIQLSHKEEAHVISINRNGEIKPSGGTVPEIIAGIEQFAQERKDAKQEAEVLFFVHGGLNTEGGAMERARWQIPLIKEQGKYPVFVLWESGGLETYMDHLLSIRQGVDEAPESWLSSPIYFLTDVGNSIVNAPKSWLVNGEHMRTSIFVPITEKEATLTKELTEVNQVSYAKTKDYKPNLFRRMRWVLGSPSKAVFTPFAYTMARPAWDVMLRRTNTLFYTPQDLELQLPPLEEKHRIRWSDVERDKPGSGALYSFLEKLKDVPDIKITLVGHSMGAIVVNKIVLLEPKLPYKNIVHMASADSINNLFNMVVPYINYSIEKKKDECPTPKKDSPECTEWARGQAAQFYSLMLHPDNEDREEAWGGLVPSGSLLTWIDSMYTSPETVLDKRSGRWDNIKSSIKFLPDEVAKNMHFKIFGLGLNEGEKCADEKFIVALGLKEEGYKKCDKPQKHGDFDRMRFWDEATWN